MLIGRPRERWENCSEAISRPAYGLDLIGNSFRLLSTCKGSLPWPAPRTPVAADLREVDQGIAVALVAPIHRA